MILDDKYIAIQYPATGRWLYCIAIDVVRNQFMRVTNTVGGGATGWEAWSSAHWPDYGFRLLETGNSRFYRAVMPNVFNGTPIESMALIVWDAAVAGTKDQAADAYAGNQTAHWNGTGFVTPFWLLRAADPTITIWLDAQGYIAQTITNPSDSRAYPNDFAAFESPHNANIDDLHTRLTVGRTNALDHLDVDVSSRMATFVYTAPDNATLQAMRADYTTARAGYLDKLNVAGTRAHTGNANTFKADVSGLLTQAWFDSHNNSGGGGSWRVTNE